MSKLFLEGTGTALITSFKQDGSVDENSIRKLTEWQVQNKIEFLVPCGSTGEGVTLSKSERIKVFETVLEQINGRIPVVAGTGTNSTSESIEITKDAKRAGIKIVLLVGPYYNKPTQEGFYQHFIKIVEQCNIKAVIYNVPGRTGSNILPETTLRLAEHENIIGVKEASNNLEQIMQIIKYKPKNFSVLSGEDSLTLPIIASGGNGVISVISNEVPKEYGDMVRFAMKGDFVRARQLHYKLFELMKANFIESNPIPVKTALSLMGKAEENFRLPLTKISPQNKKKLLKVLKVLNLI